MVLDARTGRTLWERRSGEVPGDVFFVEQDPEGVRAGGTLMTGEGWVGLYRRLRDADDHPASALQR